MDLLIAKSNEARIEHAQYRRQDALVVRRHGGAVHDCHGRRSTLDGPLRAHCVQFADIIENGNPPEGVEENKGIEAEQETKDGDAQAAEQRLRHKFTPQCRCTQCHSWLPKSAELQKAYSSATLGGRGVLPSELAMSQAGNKALHWAAVQHVRSMLLIVARFRTDGYLALVPVTSSGISQWYASVLPIGTQERVQYQLNLGNILEGLRKNRWRMDVMGVRTKQLDSDLAVPLDQCSEMFREEAEALDSMRAVAKNGPPPQDETPLIVVVDPSIPPPVASRLSDQLVAPSLLLLPGSHVPFRSRRVQGEEWSCAVCSRAVGRKVPHRGTWMHSAHAPGVRLCSVACHVAHTKQWSTARAPLRIPKLAGGVEEVPLLVSFTYLPPTLRASLNMHRQTSWTFEHWPFTPLSMDMDSKNIATAPVFHTSNSVRLEDKDVQWHSAFRHSVDLPVGSVTFDRHMSGTEIEEAVRWGSVPYTMKDTALGSQRMYWWPVTGDASMAVGAVVANVLAWVLRCVDVLQDMRSSGMGGASKTSALLAVEPLTGAMYLGVHVGRKMPMGLWPNTDATARRHIPNQASPHSAAHRHPTSTSPANTTITSNTSLPAPTTSPQQDNNRTVATADASSSARPTSTGHASHRPERPRAVRGGGAFLASATRVASARYQRQIQTISTAATSAATSAPAPAPAPVPAPVPAPASAPVQRPQEPEELEVSNLFADQDQEDGETSDSDGEEGGSISDGDDHIHTLSIPASAMEDLLSSGAIASLRETIHFNQSNDGGTATLSSAVMTTINTFLRTVVEGAVHQGVRLEFDTERFLTSLIQSVVIAQCDDNSDMSDTDHIMRSLMNTISLPSSETEEPEEMETANDNHAPSNGTATAAAAAAAAAAAGPDDDNSSSGDEETV